MASSPGETVDNVSWWVRVMYLADAGEAIIERQSKKTRTAIFFIFGFGNVYKVINDKLTNDLQNK